MVFLKKKQDSKKMYLIVGLGNPEPEYSYTRHNMGFDVINKLSEKYNIKTNKSTFKSLYGLGTIEGQKVILCKPQTYMNLSGEAISEISKFYKIPLEDIIIMVIIHLKEKLQKCFN